MSGLELPRGVPIAEHEEQWNEFNGDGEAWIVIQLTESTHTALADEASREGYRPIDPADPEYDAILQRSKGVTRGLYRMKSEGNPFNYEMAVLDAEGHRLIVSIVET